MSRILALLAAVTLGGCATYHAAPPWMADEFYAIGGHEMHLMKAGSGPPVIFSGGGGINDPYVGLEPLMEGLKDEAAVALYERAGYGRSAETTVPRAVDTVTDEMDQLFTAAGLRAPFVLVGHSMASLELLRYAQRFPSKVRAVVLLEGAPPKFYRTMKIPSDFEQGLSTWLFGLAKGNALEVKSLVANAQTVIDGGSLGNVPLYYVYAGANGIAGWAEAQQEFAGLSNRAQPTFIADANHFIFEKNTEILLKKLREILKAQPPL